MTTGEQGASVGFWRGLRTISRYQWLVLIACYAGGLFDGLDSTLFTAVLPVSVRELIGTADPAQVSQKGAYITALFLLGWTSGGLVFGMLGDKIGRVKALSMSILLYALFTGLCGFAQTWEQLALFRFMTALGIGGELIVGTTLLAEAWPEEYRARVVGFLTTAYQAGVLLVGVNNFILGQLSWRYLFFVGALPALMVMVLRRTVKEPERWLEASAQHALSDAPEEHTMSHLWKQFRQLFLPQYLPKVLLASTFTGAMLIAYWASSFWIPTWIHQLLPGEKPVREVSTLLFLQGLFAMAGCIVAGILADKIGRRWTVMVSMGGYLLVSLGMFGLNHTFNNAIYAWGAGVGWFIGMSIAICYIYVPELFPTRIRGTGTGFCFNLGRIAAAGGVIYSSQLVSLFHGSYAQAAMTLSLALIAALVVAMFTPETKGQPLLD